MTRILIFYAVCLTVGFLLTMLLVHQVSKTGFCVTTSMDNQSHTWCIK